MVARMKLITVAVTVIPEMPTGNREGSFVGADEVLRKKLSLRRLRSGFALSDNDPTAFTQVIFRFRFLRTSLSGPIRRTLGPTVLF